MTIKKIRITKTLCAIAGLVASLQLHAAPLRVEGGRLIDPQGGDVVLRGFNLSQLHKVPPFRPNQDPQLFEKLALLGVNAVRLQFNWEAFEPEVGVYDETYLDYYAGVVERAAAQNVLVLVDVHQDAFSRWTLGGCGEGFPRWAIPADTPQSPPDNGVKCKNWGAQAGVFSRTTMERTFNAFMAPGNLARDRYLAMLGRLAQRFAKAPNVIGYDLINEPFGTAENILKLYQDGAARVRAEHPDAIVFVEPEVWTATGLQTTRLSKPAISNLVFAPHYYDPLFIFKIVSVLRYEPVGARNRALARSWDAAVMLGEFGAQSWSLAPGYIGMIYSDLEAFGESSMQWSYTPEWNRTTLDGWNNEDLSVVDDKGALRNNFSARPYVRRTAGAWGTWKRTGGKSPTVSYRWQHQPGKGATEMFFPSAWLNGRSAPTISVTPSSVNCQWTASSQLVQCTSDQAVPAALTVR